MTDNELQTYYEFYCSLPTESKYQKMHFIPELRKFTNRSFSFCYNICVLLEQNYDVNFHKGAYHSRRSPSAETRKKLSIAQRGRKRHTEESKARIGAAVTARQTGCKYSLTSDGKYLGKSTCALHDPSIQLLSHHSIVKRPQSNSQLSYVDVQI